MENKKSKWDNLEYRQHQYKYYSELITCDLCNVQFCRGHKTRHLKTKTHLKLQHMKENLLTSISNAMNLPKVPIKNT